jgi:predicted nucleotidyltransferase
MGTSERMMTSDDMAGRLAGHRPEMRALGVRSLSIFGSIARGDARPDSDVDLLVDFDDVPGFVGYAQLRDRLAAVGIERSAGSIGDSYNNAPPKRSSVCARPRSSAVATGRPSTRSSLRP